MLVKVLYVKCTNMFHQPNISRPLLVLDICILMHSCVGDGQDKLHSDLRIRSCFADANGDEVVVPDVFNSSSSCLTVLDPSGKTNIPSFEAPCSVAIRDFCEMDAAYLPLNLNLRLLEPKVISQYQHFINGLFYAPPTLDVL